MSSARPSSCSGLITGLAEGPPGTVPRSMVVFFGAVNKRTQVVECHPTEFALELGRRWRLRKPRGRAPAGDSTDSGLVFLSYAREDEVAARRIWQLLHDKEVGFCRPGNPRLVLVLDQFEELFTVGEITPERAAASRAFLETLADVLENRVPEALKARLEVDLELADRLDFSARPLKVLLSLRDDFLHRLERWRTRMPSVMDNRFELRLLNGPQALEAVLEPARLRCRGAAGVVPIVDPPTGEAIVRFVANVPPDRPLSEIDAVPPLLSLLCAELNAGRGARGLRPLNPPRVLPMSRVASA